ncbi:hypothetical protein Tsp_11533 [Trichinella spiralis]|uniref:hypothetical protein n=1 Tax=Trichinella spiralis TaxID=6334 RepID=UPI0001EFE325|nr:hypothetical protein Tsp_11533 [Trichinella spiralis]
MAQILQNIRNDIWYVIGDESRLVGKLFAKIEQKTGKSRYQAAVMLAIVLFVLLIFSPNAGLLCNCICIGYPAMKTLIEVESNENANSSQQATSGSHGASKGNCFFHSVTRQPYLFAVFFLHLHLFVAAVQRVLDIKCHKLDKTQDATIYRIRTALLQHIQHMMKTALHMIAPNALRPTCLLDHILLLWSLVFDQAN